MSSGGGVFAISRDIFEHEFFGKEPFTEREAWVWMIREAAWKARKVRMRDQMIAVERGQFASSVRFMADRWQWHRARVERFLRRLKTETMISTSVETGISVITICNYDVYQRVSMPKETARETSPETPARQSRDTRETNKKTGKNIKGRKEVVANATTPPTSSKKPTVPAEHQNWQGSAEEQFYDGLPGWEKAGVPRGMLFQIGEFLDGDFPQLIDIAGRAAAAKSPRAYLGGILKLHRKDSTPTAADPRLPGWITEARAQGYPVEREGNYWRFAGGLFNDAKEQVGN